MTVEIEILSMSEPTPRKPAQPEIPLTSDYLAVHGWGETWNSRQRDKRQKKHPHKAGYAQQLLMEVERMLDA